MKDFSPLFDIALLIMAVIWIIGAVICIILNIKKYLSYRRILLESARVYETPQSPIDTVFSTKAITPLMIGFFKPVIVLPDMDFNDQELEMILSHELVHYRRKDVWFKFAVFIATAIHWFNPAIRFLNRHINNLCELSCDEQVVMEMDTQDRRFYGEMILSMLQHSSNGYGKTAQKNFICTNDLYNSKSSKKNIKRRLINMLNTRKIKKSMVILSLAVMLVIVGFGGAVAYVLGRDSNPTDSEQSQENLSDSNAADMTDNNPFTVSITPEDEVFMLPLLTMDRLNELRNSFPMLYAKIVSSYNFDINDESLIWLTWEDMEKQLDTEGDEPTTFVSRLDTEDNIELLHLQSFINPELAARLMESPYLEELSIVTWGMSNSLLFSDQFVQFVEIFGEAFIEDFVDGDILGGLKFVFGEDLEYLMDEAVYLGNFFEEVTQLPPEEFMEIMESNEWIDAIGRSSAYRRMFEQRIIDFLEQY